MGLYDTDRPSIGVSRPRLPGLLVCLVWLAGMATPFSSSAATALYDVWEIQVTNDKSYGNPFDFREIELQATFTSPSNKTYDFFGFYDGDGQGGQTGNVWKLRFMPMETGTWNYTYTWTDGTTGGSGTFDVVDTGLPGPLQVAADNPWYFETARGEPFHFRGLGFQHWQINVSRGIVTDRAQLMSDMQKDIDQGYNLFQVDGLIRRCASPIESWWLECSEAGKTRFNVALWDGYEEILRFANDRQVYIFPFAGMFYQGEQYDFTTFMVFLRYWAARFGPFYSHMGWSMTWEWTEVLQESYVNDVMTYLDSITPFPKLYSIHDASRASFASWMGFSQRQQQANDVFKGNCRSCGQHGGVESPHDQRPIIGAEDIWEAPAGEWGFPRNATEVMRGAWGDVLAGIMPLYSEWSTVAGDVFGKGTGKPRIKILFDFLYSEVDYRRHQSLNSAVSAADQQVASGIPNEEYLVYDQDGGSVTLDLSAAQGAVFQVLWLDPVTGTRYPQPDTDGGSQITFNSPIAGDSVLLLRLRTDPQPATVPSGVAASTN
ncbi:MAG TPA: DUF5060 domain-containing protein [Thiotrichales bacterium]|nr:DUF5060 domain-containing protein [Thiotrichales bacterium]